MVVVAGGSVLGHLSQTRMMTEEQESCLASPECCVLSDAVARVLGEDLPDRASAQVVCCFDKMTPFCLEVCSIEFNGSQPRRRRAQRRRRQ